MKVVRNLRIQVQVQIQIQVQFQIQIHYQDLIQARIQGTSNSNQCPIKVHIQKIKPFKQTLTQHHQQITIAFLLQEMLFKLKMNL